MAASSSTMRIEPDTDFAWGRGGKTAASDIHSLSSEWEFNNKSGALTDPAIHFDLSCMLLNDSIRHRQPQAGSTSSNVARLGGEERVIYPLDVLLGYAGARVGNHDLYAVAVDRADGESPALRHCVFGVKKEVQEDLLQLTCISVDGGQAGTEALLHM